MLASVVDLVVVPPMYGLFDPSFVRTLRPVVRVPAPVVDTVIPPCTYVFVGRVRCSMVSPTRSVPRATELPARRGRVRAVSTSLARGDPG